MSSSSLPSSIQMSSTHSSFSQKKYFQIGISSTDNNHFSCSLSFPNNSYKLFHKSVPLAASIAILLWSTPAHAGFMSGMTGIESIPGPELPQIDFLNRFNEQNQKKYAEYDERFKSSPLLKKLLEQSKLNKEK